MVHRYLAYMFVWLGLDKEAIANYKAVMGQPFVLFQFWDLKFESWSIDILEELSSIFTTSDMLHILIHNQILVSWANYAYTYGVTFLAHIFFANHWLQQEAAAIYTSQGH